MDEQREWLKVTEVAEAPSQAGRVLGTSGQWVTHLARSGELRGAKTALGWLVDPKDVERVAEKRGRHGQAATV